MLRDFTKEKFDIIIQAGQSNSLGAGKGAADEPYLTDWGKSENVLFLNPDFTISEASEKVWGNTPIGDFSLSFARKYIEANKLNPDRKLLIIKAAEGNTGFCDNRWGMNDDLFLRLIELIETAKTLNPSNKFVCFLWHQGETDALLNEDYNSHYKNLLNLLEKVREVSQDKNLPFISGDFVQQWKSENMSIAVPVSDAVKNVCENCKPAVFVETTGLKSNLQAEAGDDDIHFCRNSLYLLGERMYDAYTEIVNKKEKIWIQKN